MLVRLQLLKMARESLPGADIDTVIEAAEKFAAFVEDDGGPTVESERVSRPLDTIVHTRADGASFQDLKKSFDDDPSPAADEPTAQVIEVPPEPAAKKHRSSLTRFPAHELKDPAELRHMKSNAAAEGRTNYPATVIDPKDSPALLVSGKNNRKLGDRIEKGHWKGFQIYHLTLEERATCPTDCYLWDACYGNAMGQARRHSTKDLEGRLAEEIRAKAVEHPEGFAVRLHTLGDFFSVAYVAFWEMILFDVPQLHVFGFTARKRDSDIGRAIKSLTDKRWDRFAIRFSDADAKGQGSTVIDRLPETPQVDEGTVCPAQTGRTQCCGTCGLCWSPTNRMDTIVFVKHGVIIEGELPKAETKAAAQKKPANPSVAEARRLNLTEKQSVFYAALKKRLESGERFILKDVAKDIGTGTENAYATGTALHRKGFIRVTRHGGGKPSTYAILKDENGEKLARPLVSAAPAPPERPTERPAAKPAPRPAPTIPPKTPKPAHKPAVSPVNKHLVRAPRPVSLNAPAPKKTEAPAYDESMVRRFEPKSREMMIREALEGQGYVVKSAGSDNWGKSYFYVDDKKMEADKAIELADEIRVAKGLEPIGQKGAA